MGIKKEVIQTVNGKEIARFSSAREAANKLNLDSSRIINSTKKKKGILVEKINIKGKSLEEYFMNKVGGAE